MALPKAVQKQVDEANQLAVQLNQQRLDAQAPPPEQKAPVEPGAPAPAAAPAPVGEQPTPPAPPAPADGWEQKYRVLQGKYNAEVPRLVRQAQERDVRIEQMSQQLTATQNMLAALSQNRVPAAPAGQSPAPAATTKLVKDEEVRDFGEDLIDVMRRVAREELAPVESRFKPMQQQVERASNVAAQVAQQNTQSAQERLFATLDEQVPGWTEQNEDSNFLAWLAQPDPYSGQARSALLKQAYERHDTPRVLAFFKGYRTEHAVVTPPPAPAAPTQEAPQRTLESFVAPGTPKTGTTGAQDGAGKGRIWDQAEIKQFYTDAAAGKFRTNKQRRDEIEREIHVAVREGRVR
jgi:hypothetical protein